MSRRTRAGNGATSIVAEVASCTFFASCYPLPSRSVCNRRGLPKGNGSPRLIVARRLSFQFKGDHSNRMTPAQTSQGPESKRPLTSRTIPTGQRDAVDGGDFHLSMCSRSPVEAMRARVRKRMAPTKRFKHLRVVIRRSEAELRIFRSSITFCNVRCLRDARKMDIADGGVRASGPEPRQVERLCRERRTTNARRSGIAAGAPQPFEGPVSFWDMQAKY